MFRFNCITNKPKHIKQVDDTFEILNILYRLRQTGTIIKFAWVPGNERSDKMAKES